MRRNVQESLFFIRSFSAVQALLTESFVTSVCAVCLLAMTLLLLPIFF